MKAKNAIRVLLVEDSDDDAQLIIREISRNGYEVQHLRVEFKSAMEEALAQQKWDIVISDYSMPRFSGFDAFATLKKTGQDIPFLIVSGAIGEQTAVDAMKAGVHDYLMKNNLARLVPSIERELRDAKSREERRLAKASLIEIRTQTEAEREQIRKREHASLEMALHAAKIKDQFLANVSHELRTPLNTLIGMAELLADTTLTGEQSKYLETMEEAGQELLLVVNNLLSFSSIATKKAALAETDFSIRAVLKKQIDSLMGLALEKNLAIEAIVADEVPDQLSGDSERLGQIMLNLIGNAIKFTEKGSITVRIVLEQPFPGNEKHAAHAQVTIRCSVSDTGIGAPEGSLSYLFQPFTQGDGSLTRKYGGTGLGLAICKSFVDLMRGRIGAQSEEGKGSTFWFNAPFTVRHHR